LIDLSPSKYETHLVFHVVHGDGAATALLAAGVEESP
jgi:hypothetical protein